MAYFHRVCIPLIYLEYIHLTPQNVPIVVTIWTYSTRESNAYLKKVIIPLFQFIRKDMWQGWAEFSLFLIQEKEYIVPYGSLFRGANNGNTLESLQLKIYVETEAEVIPYYALPIVQCFGLSSGIWKLVNKSKFELFRISFNR